MTELSSSPKSTALPRVSQMDGPISADLNGELAILDPASGLYFGLNEVGALIWNFIATEKSVTEIVDRVLEEYNIDRDKCTADVVRLLGQLEMRDLLKMHETIG
jgi:hypothetical protein